MNISPGQRWKRNDIVVEIIDSEGKYVTIIVVQSCINGLYSVGTICKFSAYKFSAYKFKPNTNEHSDERSLYFEYMTGQDSPA